MLPEYQNQFMFQRKIVYYFRWRHYIFPSVVAPEQLDGQMTTNQIQFLRVIIINSVCCKVGVGCNGLRPKLRASRETV